MADYAGAIGAGVSGLGSLLGGFATADADNAQAQGYDTAANYAQMNSLLAGESGGIQELQAARQIQRTEGTQIATAAGNGLKLGGSAASIVRDSTQTGALQEGVIGLQTSINVTNYEEQQQALHGAAQAAKAAAKSAETSGIMGGIGGVLGIAAKLFF